jgi:hypothetical protein
VKRLEAWGAELAMALRRESDMRAALLLAEQHLDEATQAREALERRILTASTDELYMGTQEYADLPSRREAETEIIPFQDQMCPGVGCPHWERNIAHRHSVDGQIYALKINGIPQDWAS